MSEFLGVISQAAILSDKINKSPNAPHTDYGNQLLDGVSMPAAGSQKILIAGAPTGTRILKGGTVGLVGGATRNFQLFVSDLDRGTLNPISANSSKIKGLTGEIILRRNQAIVIITDNSTDVTAITGQFTFYDLPDQTDNRPA